MMKRTILEEILKRIELINYNVEEIDKRTKAIEKSLKSKKEKKDAKRNAV